MRRTLGFKNFHLNLRSEIGGISLRRPSTTSSLRTPSRPSLHLLTKSLSSSPFFFFSSPSVLLSSPSPSSSSSSLVFHFIRSFASESIDNESKVLKERLKRIEDLNAQGCEYMNTKLFDAAEQVLKEAITLLPEASELSKRSEQPASQQANISSAPSALKRLISLSSKSTSKDQEEEEVEDSEDNDDPDISLLGATILNNLGMICAEQHFLPLSKKSSPSSPSSSSSSSSSSSASSKFEEAVEFLQESLHIRRKHRGLIHPDTSTTLSNLGAVYQRKGDHNLALNYYEEATNGLEDFLSRLQAVATSADIHPRKLEEQLLKSRKLLAVTLNNAAISYCRLAESETSPQDRDAYECDAMNCWTRSLELFEGKPSSSSSSSSSSASSASASTSGSGSFSMSTPIVDVTNVDYVTSIRNLGALHSRREEFGASIAFWKKLLKLQEEEFGKKDTKLISTLSSLATTLMNQTRKEEKESEGEGEGEERKKRIKQTKQEAIETLERAVNLETTSSSSSSSSTIAKRLQQWKQTQTK